MREPETDTVTISERQPDPEILEALIGMSEDWEAENSCYGYRRNGIQDIEGNRVFIAEEGGIFTKD